MQKKKKKVVFCIMGKSATGKSTIVNNILKDGMFYVKSFTDREIRKDDPNDINTHTFVTKEDFEKDLHNEEIISLYNSPSGYHNWVSESSFKGNLVNIFVIDIKAFTEIIDNRSDEFIVYGIYLKTTEEDRKKKYINRNGSLDGYNEEKHLELTDEIYEKYKDYLSVIEMKRTATEIDVMLAMNHWLERILAQGVL